MESFSGSVAFNSIVTPVPSTVLIVESEAIGASFTAVISTVINPSTLSIPSLAEKRRESFPL